MAVSRYQKVDWFSKASVIRFAKVLGPGQTVYKHPSRINYNICHTVNEFSHKIPEEWVVFRTGNGGNND
jgi:hypothetical protein